MNILNFPIARITIWFVAGIIFAYHFVLDLSIAFTLFTSCFLMTLIFYKISQSKTKFRLTFTILMYFLATLSGIVTQTNHKTEFNKTNYKHCISENKTQVLKVILREKLRSNNQNQRYIALVHAIDGRKCNGKILINFKNGKRLNNFHIGHNLIVSGRLVLHSPPLNPNQFDYGKYLENKSISAQVYLDQQAFSIVGTTKDIWYYSDILRSRMISRLSESGFRNQELNVVSALILGQQQDISPDIMKDYQYAGAVHILSVSGLHVGFVLLMINFLLRPVPKTKWGNTIKCVVVICSLWGFAVIAGLSPSVVRSVTMFSFVAWGMYLKRSTNIFHTLVASLLIILLFEPSFLFDVGFQLSYTALFFILWLQPLLSSLWKPKYFVVKYFWDILTVSFAAQIGALPLSIYYFHQFPGLFFVTNLIIIPFLSVIMFLGLLVMMLALFNAIPQMLATILERCIYYLDEIIKYIASFTEFIISDIPFNFCILSTAYLVIVSMILWIKQPRFTRAVFVLVGLITLQVSTFASIATAKKQEELLIWHQKKATIILIRRGASVIAFGKSNAVGIHNNKNIETYLTANFIKIDSIRKLQNTLIFHDHKILIIDSTALFPTNVSPEIILLTESTRVNLDRVVSNLKPKLVVADGSNFKSYAKIWSKTCRNKKIPFHYTGEKGFYRIR